MNMQQKKKIGDTSLIGTVIAAICIIIYLFALVQATIRLYLSVDQQKNMADLEFDLIANLALASGNQGFMDEPFVSSMNQALASSRTIEALIISGPDGRYAFERQRGYAVTWVNNSPRPVKKFGFYSEGLYRSLPIQNIRNVNIEAVAGAFNYTEITKILKETLFLILIGFTLAFFTMLLQLLLGKPEETAASTSFTEENLQPAQNVNKTAVDDDISFDDLETAVEDTPVEVAANENIDNEPAASEDNSGKEDGPKGLYSPRSNIGWEEYTDERLDSELHRGASTENDLILLFIEFADIIDDAQYKQAAEEAISFFMSKDLLFERGRLGITVIIPGIDLETGLVKAQNFRQRIKEKLFINEDADDCVFIGLSSRAGRILNAWRLKMEANEALNKARKDPDTSLIAFKSDPEKYRKFIASQNPRHS
jgi:hypothetical protein